MTLKNNIQNTFREGRNYKYLLLSVLITGLSYGLYKGMLDNFLAIVSAVLGLCNSAYAASIKTKKKPA